MARPRRTQVATTTDESGLLASEALRQEFTELGLSPYEARVLVALLKLGSANTLQLAQVSGVPRTSTYQVLEALAGRRLAGRIPGEGPAVWAGPKREEVFERLQDALEAAQQEKLHQHRARAARAAELLAASLPEAPAVALPYVHVLPGPSQVKKAYEDMVSKARDELVMFTRPPYAWVMGRPNPSVMEMLAKGVSARVLYQADKWNQPDADAFRQEMNAYHQAGVEARVVDHLPIKLVIVDRSVALVGMSDPVSPEAGYPTALLVEHPGYAWVQAAAFDHLWAQSRPLGDDAPPAPPRRRARLGSHHQR